MADLVGTAPVDAGRPSPKYSATELAERYARMISDARPRRVDIVLRGLDFVLAGTGLALLAPLMLVIAALIRLTSGPPVLYRGVRVGRAGRTYTMFKFRTLAPDAERRLGPHYGPELSRRTAAELAPLGRALRKVHLDETPQLINVVRGDMSLVGPRPIRPAFFVQLSEQIPQYWQRLVVRPGMTGFAQLRLTREMSWAEKLAHDFEYLADRSVGLYLRVLAATAVRVLGRVSTVHRPDDC